MTPTLLNRIAKVCQRLRVDPYLVGGSVRDRLLNRESHDWDFVCRNAQKVAHATARSLSAKLITLDDQNRIYRIIQKGGITLDFAELQGKTIEQDLARRDFTFNAMASTLNLEKVIDPFSGQKDLKKKIVRALSRKAFQDDPLRLLRAYRMAAQFNSTLESQTRKWITAEHRQLEGRQVARERVREELLRLFSQPSCATALAAMDESGLLTSIFPELEAGRRVGLDYYGKGGVVKHHLQSVANVEWILDHSLEFLGGSDIAARVKAYVDEKIGGFPRSAYLKLGALLHDLGKPATAQVIRGRLRFFGHEDVGARMVRKILDTLRFSRQESGLVRLWVANHMRPGNLASLPAGKAGVPQLTEKAVARFFRDLGEDGVGMLIVSLGDHYTYLDRGLWGKDKDVVEQTSKRLLTAYYHRREAVLPPKVINGHVLMKKLRLKPGPVIGKLLEAIRDAQAEGLVKTAEAALAFARKVLRTKD
jgi:putative nucleotidyltransferase with HDIG domain